MSSKHTPGPWITLGCNLWGARSQLVARWGTFRFSDGSKAQPVTPTEADAQLIAAAPEMLDALEAAEWSMRHLIRRLGDKEENNENLRNVRAAIAKAEKKGVTNA